MSTPEEILYLKKQKIKLLERELFLRENLPFMVSKNGLGCNAHPLYEWQEEFIRSTSKLNFLTAANQIGKSAAGIIKSLRWGYLKELWPGLWKQTPTMALYFYPDKKTAYREFKEKWEKVYLPSKKLKKDETWGFNPVYSAKKEIDHLVLASGITIYFLSYEQALTALQASSVAWVMADEEMPSHLFAEVMLRVSRGYYHNIFTATLSQLYLYNAIEQIGTPDESFPDAYKRQITMYDCLTYSDGSKSEHVTEKHIEDIKSRMPDEKEIQRRVYGRFILSKGLRFDSFDHQKNVAAFHATPKSWQIYAGMDWGSGGNNHPSAIVWIAVCPEFLRARVIKSWIGKGIKTTQGDLIEICQRESTSFDLSGIFYDYSASDLGVIGQRKGLPYIRAEKSHDGIATVNTLFKNGQLIVYDINGELISELIRLPDLKKVEDDDLTDALRYAVASIPWTFKNLNADEVDAKPIKEEDPHKDMNEREKFYLGIDQPQDALSRENRIEVEFQEAIDLFDDGSDFGF